MDRLDRDLEMAERDASPDRFQESPYPNRQSHEIEKLRYVESNSTLSSESSSSSAAPTNTALSQVSTRPDCLERNPTALSRIATQRSQHGSTVGRSLKSKVDTTPLPEFGAGKEYPPLLPDREEYVVEFEDYDDPLHPHNWPLRKKVWIGVILGYTTMLASFGSSLFSASITPVSQQFGVSTQVGMLGVSLYVLGFAFGPLFWAPLSELKGRRLPIVLSTFGFTLFQAATGTGENPQTILTSRFFGGFFASCPLAVVAAIFSDMFTNATRGAAITIYSMMVFAGPMMAPFIGGFITANPQLGWRWTNHILLILGAISFLLNLLLLPETYPPIILISKASLLRRRTLNWGIHAKQEEIEISFRELVSKNFTRPLRILFCEPIVLLLSIYMAFIYGLVYLLLTAYPLVFVNIHNFPAGISGLPLLGMVVGQLLAGLYILLLQPSYTRSLKSNNGIPIPEWRLPPVCLGGLVFSLGLFIFGWTGYTPNIHWIFPTLSGIFTGFGILAILLQSINYLLDAYLTFAASALAANAFLRSLAGAGFPLFGGVMVEKLGVNWTCTLLGCIALVMVPIPVLFLKYGGRLRQTSKFAPAS